MPGGFERENRLSGIACRTPAKAGVLKANILAKELSKMFWERAYFVNLVYHHSWNFKDSQVPFTRSTQGTRSTRSYTIRSYYSMPLLSYFEYFAYFGYFV